MFSEPDRTYFPIFNKQTIQPVIQLMNSMKQSPYWEANSPWTTQEIARDYETSRFNAVFIRARHLSLFGARLIRSTKPILVF